MPELSEQETLAQILEDTDAHMRGVEEMLNKADAEARALASAALKVEADLQQLLKAVGTPGECAGCRFAVLWIRHNNGRLCMYNHDGGLHLPTCIEAAQFTPPPMPSRN